MRAVNEVFARLWRRLYAIEKEVASFGVVTAATNETGAVEREPISKPNARPVTPPKPSKPVDKQKLRGWKADLVSVAPRPTAEEALRDF